MWTNPVDESETVLKELSDGKWWKSRPKNAGKTQTGDIVSAAEGRDEDQVRVDLQSKSASMLPACRFMKKLQAVFVWNGRSRERIVYPSCWSHIGMGIIVRSVMIWVQWTCSLSEDLHTLRQVRHSKSTNPELEKSPHLSPH